MESPHSSDIHHNTTLLCRGKEGEREGERGVIVCNVILRTRCMHYSIGQNTSCASDDWLTSRPKGCSQPRELWFFDILMYMYHTLWCTCTCTVVM